jgi:hypothetical protein
MSQPHDARRRHVFLWGLLGVGLVVLFLGIACAFLSVSRRPVPARDPFLAKYERIGPGTSEEEATRLLGPPNETLCPGLALGETICWWEDSRGRFIEVTWDVGGEFSEKKFHDAPLFRRRRP